MWKWLGLEQKALDTVLGYFKTADGGYRVEVEVSDETVLTVAASVSSKLAVEEKPSLFDQSDDEFWAFQDNAYRQQFRNIARYLIRCPFCYESDLDGYDQAQFKWPWTPETQERGFPLGDGSVVDAITLALLVAPHSCPHSPWRCFDEFPAKFTPLPGPDEFDHRPRLENTRPFHSQIYPIAPLLAQDLKTRCHHQLTSPIVTPLEHDETGPFLASTAVHHYELGAGAWRCPVDFPHNIHFWSDELVEQATTKRRVRMSDITIFFKGCSAVAKGLSKMPFGKPFNICAWSPEVGTYAPDQTFDYTLTLIGDSAHVPVIAAANKVTGKRTNHYSCVVPVINGPRSLAFWRVIAGSMVKRGTRFAITNSLPSWDWIDAKKVPTRKGFYSSGLLLTQASAGVIVADGGYFPYVRNAKKSIVTMLPYCHLYGADEYFLERPIILYGNRPGIPWQTVCATRPGFVPRELSLIQSWRGLTKVYTPKFTRSLIPLISQYLGRQGTAKARDAAIPAVGKFVEAEVRDFGIVRRTLESPGCLWQEKYCVSFVSIGTTGDTVPVLGILKYLARRGFLVFHIPGTTLAEGRRLLAGSEQNNLTSEDLELWAAVAMGLQTLPGITLAPYYLFGASVPMTIAPPPYAIRSISFGLSTLGDHLLQALIGKQFLMRVGSWDCLDNVPRSTDGETFDRQDRTPLAKRTVEAYFVAGNTSETFDVPPGAVVLPPGSDHIRLFPKAKRVFCTGAGTVQTAGASGCRVIALSRKGDRDFVDPTDAGKDVRTGTPPHRVLSHIALSSFENFLVVFPLMAWYEKIFLMQLFLNRYFFTLCLFFYRASWLLSSIIIQNRIVWGSSVLHTVWSTAIFHLGFTSALSHLSGVPISFLAAHAWRHEIIDLRFCVSVAGWILVKAFLTIGGSFWLTIDGSVLGAAFLGWLVEAVFESFLPIAVGASLSSGKHADVLVQLRIFYFFGFIPGFHVRLVNSSKTHAAEGRFAGPVGEGVPYAQHISEIDHAREARLGYTWYDFGTNMRWVDVETAGVPVLRYSLFWNCHHLILTTARGQPSLLGPSVVPLLLAIVLSVTYGVAAAFMGLVALAISGGIATVLRITRGGGDTVLTRVFYRAGSEYLLVLFTPGLSLLQKSLIILTEARFSWSTADIDGTFSSRLFRLMDSEDCPGEVKKDATLLYNYVLSKLDTHIAPSVLEAYIKIYQLTVEDSSPARLDLTSDQLLASYRESSTACSQDLAALLHEYFVMDIPSVVDLLGDEETWDDDDKVVAGILRKASSSDLPDAFTGPAGEPVLLLDVLAELFLHSGYPSVPREDVESALATRGWLVGDAGDFVRWLFILSESEEQQLPEPDVSQAEVESLGQIVAQMTASGAHQEHALEAVVLQFGDSILTGEFALGEDANSIAAVRETLDAHQRIARNVDRLTRWGWNLRAGLVDGSAVWWTPFEFVITLFSRVLSELLKLVLMLISMLFAGIDV